MQFSYFSKKRIHLGVTGSIASYKAIELCRMLQKANMSVSVTLTDAACEFIRPLCFEALGANPVFNSMFGDVRNTPFAHLEPGEIADAFLIAPASAATLACLAHGMAHTMLATQALAFLGPLILAPAMNPRMWHHPATQENMKILENRGAFITTPARGKVACGDEGSGKLADTSDIYMKLCQALAPQDMQGKRVLITLGPTQEPWDGVRFWSNPSSGLMGASLAIAAYLRGADVVAIAGPNVPQLPEGIHVHSVQTAKEMATIATKKWATADFGIFTAAVADFSPKPYGKEKFKKAKYSNGFSVEFIPNTDILASLSTTKKSHQKILGFAAETQNIEEQTQEKLIKKQAHLMAGNMIGHADSGFQSATNTMFVTDYNGKQEHWPNMTKPDVAWRLLSWLLTL